MLHTKLISLLRLLRSEAVRDAFFEITARLCGAAWMGAALLYFYYGGEALAAIRSLWIVGLVLLGAAVSAKSTDE